MVEWRLLRLDFFLGRGAGSESESEDRVMTSVGGLVAVVGAWFCWKWRAFLAESLLAVFSLEGALEQVASADGVGAGGGGAVDSGFWGWMAWMN